LFYIVIIGDSSMRLQLHLQRCNERESVNGGGIRIGRRIGEVGRKNKVSQNGNPNIAKRCLQPGPRGRGGLVITFESVLLLNRACERIEILWQR